MKDLTELKKIVLGAKCLGFILIEDRHIDNNRYEEQLRCPFHGPDNKPSARYYPDTDSLYCWKCQQKWDVFGYMEDKRGYDFFSAITDLVKKFNIDISKVPDVEDKVKGFEVHKAEVKVNKKALLLIKMEEKVLSLKGTVPFERYNKMVFGFLLLKASGFNDNFLKDCELLIRGMKEIG